MKKQKYESIADRTKSVWDKFADLYHQTVDNEHHVPPKVMQKINEELSLKYIPKPITFFPIYADQPDSWQADLMFEPYVNAKGETILQALLCVININTKYAFCRPVDYVKNIKKMDERAWNDKSTRVFLNNKEAPLVLRSFKRILADMEGEADVLNGFEELKGKVKFDIKRLYVDEGGEFKGEFLAFCNEKNIRVTVFKKSTGTKRRLGVVERFNRTMRRYLDKQIKLRGSKELKDLIPHVLDLYNRYLNHRGIREFFRRDLPKGQRFGKRREDKTRFFPAMMLLPGMEQQYIEYRMKKTKEVEEYYRDMYDDLQPGAMVRYFKRNDNPLTKRRGSTLSAPVIVGERHKYDYATDKSTRTGAIKKRGIGSSIEVAGETQRYQPFEFDLSSRPKKKRAKIPQSSMKKEL
jgi:hypothetical protein